MGLFIFFLIFIQVTYLEDETLDGLQPDDTEIIRRVDYDYKYVDSLSALCETRRKSKINKT